MDAWTLVVWLHLLAMAFFIGGQLFMAGVVVPVMRGDESRDRLIAAARRFGIGTLIAFAVLIVTGVMLATHFSLWGDAKLHIKLTLFVAMAALIALHMKLPRMHALEGVIFLLSLAVMWLGVALGH